MLLGQADMSVPGKVAGVTKGTSVASLAARTLLPFKLRVRLPMITKVGLTGVRIAFTRNLGAFVGRAIPVECTLFLARDAFYSEAGSKWSRRRAWRKTWGLRGAMQSSSSTSGRRHSTFEHRTSLIGATSPRRTGTALVIPWVIFKALPTASTCAADVRDVGRSDATWALGY